MLSATGLASPAAPPGIIDEGLQSDNLWALGCFFELFGTLASVSGKQLFRHAAITGRKTSYVYGTLLVVFVYPACNVLALDYAAQTVVSTVTGTVVVWNILLAPCTLGENMTTKRMTSAMVILLGIAGAGSFGAHFEVDRTPTSELQQLAQPVSIAYYVMLATALVVGYAVVLPNQKWMPPGSVRQGALQGSRKETPSPMLLQLLLRTRTS